MMPRTYPAFADAEKAKVFTALEAIRSALPIILSLTPEQRKGLFKLGDRRMSFVQSCARSISQQPASGSRPF